MKNFLRNIRRVQKRKFIKDKFGKVTIAIGIAVKSSQMSQTSESSSFFGNHNPSNERLERLNLHQQSMIENDQNQSSTENKSIERIWGVKLGSGIIATHKEQNQISESLKDALETNDVEIESLTAQKLEFTDSQDELDALGLGNLDKKGKLVVGLPMPRSSQFTLAVHEENRARFVKESNIPINIEQKSKIVMIRTSSDLKNRKWVKEFITSIEGGAQELDEELIKSILSKVSESNLDVPSINKILEKIVEATLSFGSNGKLLKILGELEKPMNPSVLPVTPPTEAVQSLDNLQDCQDRSESSSSIFAHGFQTSLSRHRATDALMGQSA